MGSCRGKSGDGCEALALASFCVLVSGRAEARPPMFFSVGAAWLVLKLREFKSFKTSRRTYGTSPVFFCVSFSFLHLSLNHS